LIVGLEALKKKYFAFIEKSLKEIDRNINNLENNIYLYSNNFNA
jgi:hypothetical protein